MTSPGIVPIYRGLTIVGTVLVTNDEGEVIHHLVTDTTFPERVELVYLLI